MSTDDDQPRDLQLETLLDLAVQNFANQLRTGLPGMIVDYDEDAQSATVQILVQYGELVGGDRQVAPVAPVASVPVYFLGNARTRFTYSVQAGDLCWLLFSSSSLARWKALGAPNGPVDPGDDTRHRLSDAVCVVAGHTFNAIPTDAPTDAAVMHLASGHTMKVGSSGASNRVLTTADGTQFLNALAYAYNTIAISDPTGAVALAALYAALTNSSPLVPGSMSDWPTGSSKLLTDL